jgi:apolipoprotein N-acyltransferase
LAKKHLTYSILTGLFLGLSWPTYGITILVFFGFVPLLSLEKLIRKNSLIKIFLFSFLSFFIWNTIATWWLVYSTFIGMAFAILLNCLLMSIIFTSYSFVSRKADIKLSVIYWLSAWIVFEKFHLNWEFSWPWLNLGNVFSEKILWIQWYEYTGVFGGTLWVLIVNYFFFSLFEYWKKNNRINTKILSFSVLSLSIPIIISMFLYNSQKDDIDFVEASVLQPNIDPYLEKYGKTNISIFEDFKELVNSNIEPFDIIIAPETYFSESPGYPVEGFEDSPFIMALKSYLNVKNKSNLLSGIQFYQIYYDEINKTKSSNLLRDSIWIDFFNSSFFLAEENKPQIYHKSKLVPGVEIIPYKNILEPLLGNALINFGGTVSTRGTQDKREVFTMNNGTKLAPIICYESVYGEYVSEYVRNGAQFLAIITNDGWWSESQGYKQHLSYAKIRSIETRRSIARSANTGSSAIINKKGEIIDKLEYNKRGVLNGKIGLSNELTFYVKYGDIIFRFSLFFFFIIFLFSISKKKNY